MRSFSAKKRLHWETNSEGLPDLAHLSIWQENTWRAIGVSSRPKLTGIVRGKAFLHVLRRRPIGCPDSPNVPYNARCDGYDRERH
ncbi:hypothetical protein TNCV_3870081 [Trichonephila clavipes]|nr:hypothetical protein TNCV_3870081 [Trichonephila clavipes]